MGQCRHLSMQWGRLCFALRRSGLKESETLSDLDTTVLSLTKRRSVGIHFALHSTRRKKHCKHVYTCIYTCAVYSR